MNSNQQPGRAALANAAQSPPRPIPEAFTPDCSGPEFISAVYECMEAFRHMSRRSGQEISGDALEGFGASLYSCTLRQVNGLTAKLQAHTGMLPY